MNFKNPTYIHVGQSATYAGLTWQVLGRVVLGVVEHGETYYWHEFNLQSDTGDTATLVFERTERGAEWRWFTQFQPQYPLTAEDAATQEVGDQLNLEGTDVRVSLVETSRIYFIEGQPAEGEHVDATARYFNAQHGDDMIVVSWTGDAVEYYRGRTISNREVRAAFHLDAPDLPGVPPGGLSRFDTRENEGFSGSAMVTKVLLAILVLIAGLFLCKFIFMRTGSGPGITRITAPASPLSLGATGRVASVNYRLTGHALLQLSEVNWQLEQHEYYLRDDQNQEAVLIMNFHPHDPDWVLFTPMHPLDALTPYQAARRRLGEIVDVAGLVVPVEELFSVHVQSAEFVGAPEVSPGETFYGFSGTHEGSILVANWNASGIHFWRGRSLSSRSVLAAFAPATPAK